MVTLESFTDETEQVEHLIKWWISRTKSRYHRVLLRGTVRDFINDVWLKLLRDFRDDKQVECSMSTAVIHQCHWTLVDNILPEYRRATYDFRHKQRSARRVKCTDRIGGSEASLDYAEAAERDRAIAGVLCSIPIREAAVIRARYGLFGDAVMTLEQVGRAMQRSRERVRQLETVGIKRMQHHTLASKLFPFVDEETHKRKTQDHIEWMKSSEYGQALAEELMKDF